MFIFLHSITTNIRTIRREVFEYSNNIRIFKVARIRIRIVIFVKNYSNIRIIRIFVTTLIYNIMNGIGTSGNPRTQGVFFPDQTSNNVSLWKNISSHSRTKQKLHRQSLEFHQSLSVSILGIQNPSSHQKISSTCRPWRNMPSHLSK